MSHRRKHLPDKKIRAIRQLYQNGMNMKSIAKKLRVCATTVRKYVADMREISPPPRSLRSTHLIARAIRQGKFSDAAIANAFEVDKRYVAQLRKSFQALDEERQDTERWLQEELRSSARGMFPTGNDKH